MKKEMTIEQLGQMTQRGLADVEARLGGRIKEVKEEVADVRKAMSEGFKATVEGFREIRNEIRELGDRFDVSRHARQGEMGDLTRRVKSLEGRKDKVEMVRR